MPIVTDERLGQDFSPWVTEKSTKTLKAIVSVMDILQGYKKHLSDRDREKLIREFNEAIYNACLLAAFGQGNLDNWATDERDQTRLEGKAALENFLRTLGYEIPNLENEKNLSREVVEQVIQFADSDDPQIFNYLEQLSKNELAELVALVWIGRSEIQPDKWEYAIREAKSTVTNPINYLTEKNRLSSYLRKGMDDLDRLQDSPFST